MVMIKLLGAALLALSGWYAGVAVCAKMTEHRISLEETVTLLKILEEEISYRKANLPMLYRQLAIQKRFSALGVLLPEQDGQDTSSVITGFQTLCAPRSFTKEERAAFSACFSRLGYTSATQECERLARYHKQFETYYENAKKTEYAALAIDRKIGLALGSMLALMLL